MTATINHDTTIMDSNFLELKFIAKKALLRFDDYQQICEDDNKQDKIQYFVDAYNQLEGLIFGLKPEQVTDELRGKIRLVIKETEKMASVESLN